MKEERKDLGRPFNAAQHPAPALTCGASAAAGSSSASRPYPPVPPPPPAAPAVLGPAASPASSASCRQQQVSSLDTHASRDAVVRWLMATSQLARQPP